MPAICRHQAFFRGASAKLVFEALTRADQLLMWWGHDAFWHVEKVELELKVGGAWKARGKDLDGGEAVAHGVFRVIDPPSVVEFTQTFIGLPMMGGSEEVVRFDIVDQICGTQVSVSHYPSGNANHDAWSQTLRWLGDFLSFRVRSRRKSILRSR